MCTNSHSTGQPVMGDRVNTKMKYHSTQLRERLFLTWERGTKASGRGQNLEALRGSRKVFCVGETG